jgi:hypothetical protein
MGNTAAAAAHSIKRTKDWLEKNGYVWADMEIKKWIDPNRGHEAEIEAGTMGVQPMFPTKRDQFGCDLLAMNGVHVVFIQVKTNDRHMRQGQRDLCSHPYPPGSKRWVVRWEKGAREPEILDCSMLPTSTAEEALAVVRAGRAGKKAARKNAAQTDLF